MNKESFVLTVNCITQQAWGQIRSKGPKWFEAQSLSIWQGEPSESVLFLRGRCSGGGSCRGRCFCWFSRLGCLWGRLRSWLGGDYGRCGLGGGLRSLGGLLLGGWCLFVSGLEVLVDMLVGVVMVVPVMVAVGQIVMVKDSVSVHVSNRLVMGFIVDRPSVHRGSLSLVVSFAAVVVVLLMNVHVSADLMQFAFNGHHLVCDVGVFDSVDRLRLDFVEQLIVLVLDVVHHLRAAVVPHIVAIDVASVVAMVKSIVTEVLISLVMVVVVVTAPLGTTLVVVRVLVVAGLVGRALGMPVLVVAVVVGFAVTVGHVLVVGDVRLVLSVVVVLVMVVVGSDVIIRVEGHVRVGPEELFVAGQSNGVVLINILVRVFFVLVVRSDSVVDAMDRFVVVGCVSVVMRLDRVLVVGGLGHANNANEGSCKLHAAIF